MRPWRPRHSSSMCPPAQSYACATARTLDCPAAVPASSPGLTARAARGSLPLVTHPQLGALRGGGPGQPLVRHGQRGPHHQDLGPGLRAAAAHAHWPHRAGDRPGHLGAQPLHVQLRPGQDCQVLGPGAQQGEQRGGVERACLARAAFAGSTHVVLPAGRSAHARGAATAHAGHSSGAGSLCARDPPRPAPPRLPCRSSAPTTATCRVCTAWRCTRRWAGGQGGRGQGEGGAPAGQAERGA
jgi:hypothetical protein